MLNSTVHMLIRYAYGTGNTESLGLPGWAETDRFDVVARASGEAADTEMRGMVRTLLAERFSRAATLWRCSSWTGLNGRRPIETAFAYSEPSPRVTLT